MPTFFDKYNSKINFGPEIAQNDSKLASSDGILSYNTLAKTSNKTLSTTQRVSTVVTDSTLET